MVNDRLRYKRKTCNCRRTRHECHPESESPQDPSRNGQWTEKVGAKVCRLKTTGHARRDIEDGLEVRIQDVEKPVGETPEKE
jgi:hypothetical protein